MSKFEGLKNTISSALMRTEVYQHGSSLVPKPNEKELIARLQPEKLGVERGKENLPPLHMTQFDEVETKIIDTMQEMVDNTSKDMNEALKTYNDRLSSLSVTDKLGEIRNSCRSGITDFMAEIANGRNFLHNHKDDVLDRDRDLTEFRKDHHIRRTASYPEGGAKMLALGIIVFLFAVEFAGNSVFLSKGNEMGIVGAATEALVISFINIGGAFLAGRYVARYVHHRAMVLKVYAVVFTCAFLCFAVWSNLLVAHYREVSGSGLFGAAGKMAISAMKENPFGLVTIEGWMLFLLGLMFWLISIIDAHGLDDRYPGYGDVSRRARGAREEYAHRVQEIVEELRDKRDEGEEVITEARSELNAILARIGTLKNARNALLADYDMFKNQVEKVCIRIVEKYRTANRSVRDDVPESFQLVPMLEFRSDFSALNSSFNVDEEASSIASAHVLLDKSIETFFSQFSDKVESLDPLSKVLAR